MLKIYHNNRCRKSRETFAIINEKGLDVEVIEYLTNPPTEEEISDLLQLLNIKAEDLIRKGEAIYKENYKGKSLTEKEWISALAENPKLIERPIVVNGKKAVIGRPPEKVLDII